MTTNEAGEVMVNFKNRTEERRFAKQLMQTYLEDQKNKQNKKRKKFIKEEGIVYLNVVAGDHYFRSIRHIVDREGYLRIIDEDCKIINNRKRSRVNMSRSGARQVSIDGKLKVVVERKIEGRKQPPLKEYYVIGNKRLHISEVNSPSLKSTKLNNNRSLSITVKPKHQKIDKQKINSHSELSSKSINSVARKKVVKTESGADVTTNLGWDHSDNNRQINMPTLDLGSITPQKRHLKLTVPQRSKILVQQLKTLYNDYCQICGTRIDLGEGESMSEVHHIQPLGSHNGPDIAENMIVVCPNDHTLFDRGAITVDLERECVIHINSENLLHGRKLLSKHKINSKFVEYHNTFIYKGTIPSSDS
ncbi:HNH endonuclease [Paenibacillus residui]|uniref:HNH endonuclease n=1 Tax=Paenibacillus residui TaxID=629724 RepID=A0ABW3DEG7_9BACL